MLLSHGLSCRRRAERTPYKQDVRSNASQITTCCRSISIISSPLHTVKILKLFFRDQKHTIIQCFLLHFSRGIPKGTHISEHLMCVIACGIMANLSN